jgi:uncharacterized membrane protein YgaE (UPF0421/DUF939 family)
VTTEQTSHLYVLRTSVAALLSYLLARVFTLPEPYWAPVTTLVVMQSSLLASWSVSWRRVAGTALGAIVGGALGHFFGPNPFVYAAAVFGTGLICLGLRLDRSAYRFTGVTLAIVMLVARDKPAWVIAWHRFAEVSIGIALALAFTAVWPETETES